LKTTFLKYDSMIIFNTFVSCVIGLEERLWSLMISIATMCSSSLRLPTYVVIPLLVNETCRCTNIKQHTKSNNVWVFIVVKLLHLIVIDNRKQGVWFEDKLGSFWLHHPLRSNLKVPKLRLHVFIPNFQDVKWWRKWHTLCVDFTTLNNCQLCDLVFHNTNNICFHVSIYFFHVSGLNHVLSICIKVFWCKHHWLGFKHEGHENFLN
jgi:hypothetical protein